MYTAHMTRLRKPIFLKHFPCCERLGAGSGLLVCVLGLGAILWGCATERAHFSTIYSTELKAADSRLVVDGEQLNFRVDRPGTIRKPILIMPALPEVCSISRPLPNTPDPVVHSATEPWINLYFERTSRGDGDIVEVHAQRADSDFCFRYHIPVNQNAFGLEVECRPAAGVRICSVTHNITLPNLDPEYTFWSNIGTDESPVAIPIAQPVIAMVTEPLRCVALSSNPDQNRGVIERDFHIFPEDDVFHLNLANTCRAFQDNTLGYRLIFSWMDFMPVEDNKNSKGGPRKRK